MDVILSSSWHSVDFKPSVFAGLSPWSRPTCAPPRSLWRRVRRPQRGPPSPGLARAGRSAAANECAPTPTPGRRATPPRTRWRRSGRGTATRWARRVPPESRGSRPCTPGQWPNQQLLLRVSFNGILNELLFVGNKMDETSILHELYTGIEWSSHVLIFSHC